MGPSAPLGVDLVEWDKAGRFYETHRDRLADVFHPREAMTIRESRDPARSCAVFLAAKEAVFKAYSFPWMGRQGFRDIRIVPRPGGALSFRLEGNFRQRSGRMRPKARLSCRKDLRYVIVRCEPEGIR